MQRDGCIHVSPVHAHGRVKSILALYGKVEEVWFKGGHKHLDRHGPAESILAAHIPSKRPSTEAGLLSTLASAISLAGGASVGQYGPLVHFGGVIGDYISKLTRDQTSPHILLACGAAAAISSGFGAPIAGLIFAHEVIVRHFSLKAIAPILLSSVVAHTVSTEFYASEPLFQVDIGGISDFYEILPLFLIK